MNQMKKSNLDNGSDCALHAVENTLIKEITIVRTHKEHTK